MSGRRIGAYGGTFDPVHNGHIEIARAIVRKFDLNELLVIPAYCPPHKHEDAISDAYHRYAMAVMATEDEPRIFVSTIELQLPERPYTFETLERLRESYEKEVQLFFIMGADSFIEFAGWREPDRILASAHVIVAARTGSEIDVSRLPERFKSRVLELGTQSYGHQDAKEVDRNGLIYLTNYVREDVSSTDIRDRVREGEEIHSMVPSRVADYMEKYGLYR
jgi:nicotinate-nucleotide adenylyltransferase